MKDHIYCYAHHQMQEARAKKFVLPALEDANAIQMAVNAFPEVGGLHHRYERRAA